MSGAAAGSALGPLGAVTGAAGNLAVWAVGDYIFDALSSIFWSWLD